MRFLIFLSSFLFTLTAGHCVESLHFLKKDQISLTDSGIFFLVNDVVCSAYSLAYVGDGIYAAECHGQCKRCDWPLYKNGNCTNQNCNRNDSKE